MKLLKLYIIVEGAGGEVDTETGNFNIFPERMAKIYQDGKIEPVSNAYAICTPHSFLKNIKQLGGETEIHRSWCDSSSGMIPTETRCPSGIVYSIEFKKDEGEVDTKNYHKRKTTKLSA